MEEELKRMLIENIELMNNGILETVISDMEDGSVDFRNMNFPDLIRYYRQVSVLMCDRFIEAALNESKEEVEEMKTYEDNIITFPKRIL